MIMAHCWIVLLSMVILTLSVGAGPWISIELEIWHDLHWDHYQRFQRYWYKYKVDFSHDAFTQFQACLCHPDHYSCCTPLSQHATGQFTAQPTSHCSEHGTRPPDALSNVYKCRAKLTSKSNTPLYGIHCTRASRIDVTRRTSTSSQWFSFGEKNNVCGRDSCVTWKWSNTPRVKYIKYKQSRTMNLFSGFCIRSRSTPSPQLPTQSPTSTTALTSRSSTTTATTTSSSTTKSTTASTTTSSSTTKSTIALSSSRMTTSLPTTTTTKTSSLKTTRPRPTTTRRASSTSSSTKTSPTSSSTTPFPTSSQRTTWPQSLLLSTPTTPADSFSTVTSRPTTKTEYEDLETYEPYQYPSQDSRQDDTQNTDIIIIVAVLSIVGVIIIIIIVVCAVMWRRRKRQKKCQSSTRSTANLYISATRDLTQSQSQGEASGGNMGDSLLKNPDTEPLYETIKNGDEESTEGENDAMGASYLSFAESDQNKLDAACGFASFANQGTEFSGKSHLISDTVMAQEGSACNISLHNTSNPFLHHHYTNVSETKATPAARDVYSRLDEEPVRILENPYMAINHATCTFEFGTDNSKVAQDSLAMSTLESSPSPSSNQSNVPVGITRSVNQSFANRAYDFVDAENNQSSPGTRNRKFVRQGNFL